MQHVYTLIVGYKEFNAITQHRAASIRGALEDWVRVFSFKLLEERNLTAEQITILKTDIAIAEPISLQPSFVNMWFVFSKLGQTEPIYDGVFGIHVVDTVMPQQDRAQ